MKFKTLSFFACPACKGPLEADVTRQEGDEVLEARLSCGACGVDYAVIGGIPRFTSRLEEIKEHTAASFGYKWRKFSDIGDYYKKNFYDELDPLDYRTFFRGKTVLDAGTGIGIPSHCLAEQGAGEVFGIDIMDSIEVPRRNNAMFDNVTIAQADIHNIPFRPGTFDVVVCVAVLQHVPDFRRAFDELMSFVKPGGTIVIWVYGREGNGFVHYVVEPLRKLVTRRMPVPLALALSIPLGVVFQAAVKLVYKPFDRLGWKFLPLHDYLTYRATFDFKMNVHMIFDQLLAPLSYLFTREEVAAFFNRPDVADVKIRRHNSNSWTAIGTKSC